MSCLPAPSPLDSTHCYSTFRPYGPQTEVLSRTASTQGEGAQLLEAIHTC